MAERTFEVTITTHVEVVVNDELFTQAVMDRFNEAITPLDSLKEHVEHLALMCARQGDDVYTDTFIEGYGPLNEVGVSVMVDMDADEPAVEVT